MPGWENDGNWMNGKIPNTLFTRMNAKSATR